MAILSFLSGQDAAEAEERHASVVKDYLGKHRVTIDRWTNVKGERSKRIYAGVGNRDGREVGFFVNFDTEFYPDITAVVIPKKTGLSTYAHHWRKLWSIDHRPESQRPPLSEYMLAQMPGEYEMLDMAEPEPVAPAPRGDEFEAEVYAAIQKTTGCNYREYFHRQATPASAERVRNLILTSEGSTDALADLVIEANKDELKDYIEALTAPMEYADDYEARYSRVNQIVFENTGFNLVVFFNGPEEVEFEKMVDSDLKQSVDPAVTAGKVIQRFKPHVAAHFMVLSGAADKAVVRDGEIFATKPKP
jgi:hypothetical protein